MRILLSALVVVAWSAGCAAPSGADLLRPRRPRAVRGMVDGFPVHAYGEFDVYSVSPTYDDSVVLQKGNRGEWRKIRPRKSWEIESNLIGLTPTRSPSSLAPEMEADAPLYFIDGDPKTVGFAGRPVGDPSITRAWVRIDLPRPMRIASVTLVGRQGGAKFPANFEVRAFRWDLWQRKKQATAKDEQKRWRTVYRVEGNRAQPVPLPDNTVPHVFQPERGETKSGVRRLVCRFEPVRAREIWLTSPDDFSLSEIQVQTGGGENVALASKGCGVTVSKPRHRFWLSEPTQASLWQMQYDLGIKWLRLSYYLTPLIWRYVERQKGVYKVDPYLDDLVSEARANGIEVTLTLGPPHNPLYKGGEKTVAGFSNYVRFMVKHFKGRVKVYEVLNEFYNQDSYGPGKKGPVEKRADAYVRIALPAAKMIRETDPKAKIALSGPCPLVADYILAILRKGMAPYADILTWHPYSFPQDTDNDYPPEQLDRPRHVWAPPEVKSYADAVAYLRREAAKVGFRGTLMANEVGAYAIHNNRTSNLIAAKYLARSAVLHTALQVPMFWNETTSLMRPAWQPFWGNQGPDLKPAYSYYMMRSLCTLLDGAKPAQIDLTAYSKSAALQMHSFALPGDRKLLALWLPEKSRKKRLDDHPGVPVDLAIGAEKPVKVVGIDLLNGREQDLAYEIRNGRIVIKDLLVRDYPLLIRLEYK